MTKPAGTARILKRYWVNCLSEPTRQEKRIVRKSNAKILIAAKKVRQWWSPDIIQACIHSEGHQSC